MVDLKEIIDSHIANFKSQLHTSIPAIIEKVNTEGEYIKSVDVKPILNKLFADGIEQESHIISNVPVAFPSGSECMLSFPLAEGDTVLLLMCHADIQKWLVSGSYGRPQTLRRFSLTDSVAIPSIQSFSKTLQPSKDNVELKYKDSLIKISPTGDIELSSDSRVTINSESDVNIDTERLNATVSKLNISNGSVELVSFLADLTEAISKITVQGKPIDNLDTFTTLLTNINTLKR